MISLVVFTLGLMTTAFALPVTPEQQVEVAGTPVTQQEEKIASPERYTPDEEVHQNPEVPKVESLPVFYENQQASTENTILLPVRPLSVVPVNPVGQVLRPVIVPVEAITTGRVIIMGIDSIQQKSLPDAVPQQEVVRPLINTPAQTQVLDPNQKVRDYLPNEKSTPPQQQVQQAEEVQYNREPLVKEVQQPEKYTPLPEKHEADQNVEPSSEVVVQDVPYQVAVRGQSVEPAVQQYQIQKQAPYPQAAPVQEAEPENQQASVTPVAVENVEKQGSQVYNVQQSVSQQRTDPVDTYVPVQNQALEDAQNVRPVEQVYEVQPVQKLLVYDPHAVEPLEQQDYSVEPEPVKKQGYVQVQTQSVQSQQQQVQSVQQTIEKHVPQRPVYSRPVYTRPHQIRPPYQHHVYNVGKVKNPVSYQQVNQQQITAQVQKQEHQIVEVEPHRQVENYAVQSSHNYGDKLTQVQQNNPAHAQDYPVPLSSVVSVHE